MMSGSSIANTVTVGSLTIPLMKKMGLSPEKAGAVEVSAGINGQIMPPVMGAAAFLMAEFLSIPYAQIIGHAFLPAILVYIALLYMIHLEALKLGLSGVTSDENDNGSIYRTILMSGIYAVSIFLTVSIIYFFIQGFSYITDIGESVVLFAGIKSYFAGHVLPVISILLFGAYVIILYFQSKLRDVDIDECVLEEKFTNVWEVLESGLHYFIPIFTLVWCLTIERLSPALSAYWTIIVLAVILITQNPIKAFFRGNTSNTAYLIKSGFKDLLDGMVLGAQNMVGVAIATAAAGANSWVYFPYRSRSYCD